MSVCIICNVTIKEGRKTCSNSHKYQYIGLLKRGKKQSIDSNIKRSKSLKNYWSDATNREKHSNLAKKIWANDDKRKEIYRQRFMGNVLAKTSSPTENQKRYWASLKEKLKGENNPFYNKKHTLDTRFRMQKKRKLFLLTHPEAIEQYRQRATGNNYHTGYRHSEEAKKKMSTIKVGKYIGIPRHSYDKEMREKVSIGIRKYYKEHGCSEETREKISKKLRGRTYQMSDAHKQAIREAQNRPEVRQKRSLSLMGRKLKLESVIKRTTTRRTRNHFFAASETIEKRMKHSGHKRFPYISKDNKIIKMRSNWEVKYAYWLDSQNYIWQYESKGFLLSTGKYYFPDFFVETLNEWHEVKGYLRKEAAEKMKLFRDEYSTLVFRIIDASSLRQLNLVKESNVFYSVEN